MPARVLPAASVRCGELRSGRMARRGAGIAMLAVAAALPLPAAPAPAAGEATCTWHVRLAYHRRDAGVQGSRDMRARLSMDTLLRCSGRGADIRLAASGPTQARGTVHLVGNVPHAGGPAERRDTYDKYAAWPGGDASADIEIPAPSFVGEGYATRVSFHAVPIGTEVSGVADPAAAARDTADAGNPRALHGSADPLPPADRIDLTLFFDPLPGTPSDPAGAIAQVPQRTTEALKVPGGEAALALTGHLFGASTRWTSDGDFSVCYQRSLTLAPTTLDIHYCGWLTRPGPGWQPEQLSPDIAD